MKKLLLPAFVLISAIASAQCTQLFFSEYIEGLSNNKALELYNPTGSTVNMTDYVIYRANNGSPVAQDSLFPQGTVAAGAVYVAGNPSADPLILAVSDTLHTITFFNGDDCLFLKHIPSNTVIDMIGQLGVDPGVNWPVGTGATSEFTLVRMIGIQQGNTNWTVAATEYDVYPQNTFTQLGSHSMTPCCAAPTVTLQSQVDVACFGDATGSLSVATTGNGPFTYEWLTRPETTSSITSIPAGTYTVVATGACGTDTMTFTIVEPPLLTQTLTASTPSGCTIASGSLSITANGGTPAYTYLWSNGATTSTISNLAAGVYTCTVTCANGCTSVDSYTVLTTSPPTVTFSFSMDTLCNLDPGFYPLAGSPAGGTWSGTGVIGSDFHPSAAGPGTHVITYTYTDSVGCFGTASDSVVVQVCMNVLEADAVDFSVQPNPFTDVVTLQFASSDNVVTVYSMQGQRVHSENVIGSVARISLEHLPVGVYTIQVVNESGVVTKKIQKL